MSFDPVLIEQARREITGAAYGHRTAKVEQWAGLLATSPQHLYRLIGDPVNKRERKGHARQPQYQAWAETIWQVKNCPPEDAGVLSTEDAVAIAVKQALVPAEAADVPVGTYNRIARDHGWHKTEKRRNRIQAARPNECHHFDGSSSNFLHIARRMPDGEFTLKLHRPASGGYKNKPIPVDRLRPYYYGLCDDHSGRVLDKCYALQGEDAGSSMTFLSWAWSVIGLCKELAMDQGMLKKCFASRDWIDRLGVALPDSMPYEKESHGKIERPWRTLWKKFELTFYAQHKDWKTFEISLTEFNQHLQNFTEQKYNQLPHRFEKKITRMQAWNRVNLHGGIVTIPENALATVARRTRRKVDVAGLFAHEGVTYEVIGLHDAWVWVWEGVFEDRLVVQDQETGKKYDVKDFRPLARGEFRAHADSPHQQIVKAAAELPLAGQGLYATTPASGEAGSNKVAHMPIRTKEERRIDDPFDVDTYPHIQQAMKDFMSHLPGIYLSPEERRDVEQAIEANGLSRRFVENFALEVRANMAKRAAM